MSRSNRLELPAAPVRQQIASKAAWNESRTPDAADFYTLGYSGRTADEILTLLKRYRVATLLDIRKNAVSMYRPELSKANLARFLAKHDIEYAHAPELGVPRDIRAMAIETGSREIIWDWYDANIVPTGLNLRTLLARFNHPIALMCTELDPRECHRHRVSLALEAMGLKSFDL